MISKNFYLVIGVIVALANLILMLYFCNKKLKNNKREKIKVILGMSLSIIFVIALVVFLLMAK